MAGLGAAIHEPRTCVDARNKSGHDDFRVVWARSLTTDFAEPDSRALDPGIHAPVRRWGVPQPDHDRP